MSKAYTFPCVRRKRALDKKIGLKCEKWLDNKALWVYTALVSHNGLVRQKRNSDGCRLRGCPEKFVQNAGTFRRTRVELCVSAQI